MMTIRISCDRLQFTCSKCGELVGWWELPAAGTFKVEPCKSCLAQAVHDDRETKGRKAA